MPVPSPLPEAWTDLPATLRGRVGDSPGRQRAMMHEGHLLLIFHAPPKPLDPAREGRFFWRDPSGEWRSSHDGAGENALERLLEAYNSLEHALDGRLERATRAGEFFNILREAVPLHRSARNLHRALQQGREMCRESPQVTNSHDVITLRDMAGELERATELLHGDARNGLDFAIASRGEQQAESGHRMAISAHRLNLLVAFFFPIATLSALFGMNFTHGWEVREAPLPFVAVLIAGVLAGVLLVAVIAPRNAAKT